MGVQPTNVRQVNSDPGAVEKNADPRTVASGAIAVSKDTTDKGTALGLGVTETATTLAGNAAGKVPAGSRTAEETGNG